MDGERNDKRGEEQRGGRMGQWMRWGREQYIDGDRKGLVKGRKRDERGRWWGLGLGIKGGFKGGRE